MRIKFMLGTALVLLLLGFTQVQLRAQSNCDEFAVDLQSYLEEQKVVHDRSVEKTQLFNRTMSELYDKMKILKNRPVDDLDWAVGAVKGLSVSISKFSEEVYALSERNFQKHEEWSERTEKCFGKTALDNFDAWVMNDAEILGTVGAIYSMYIPKMEAWIQEWQQMQQNKSIMTPTRLLDVEEKSNEFSEASFLSAELFKNTRKSYKEFWQSTKN